MLIARQRRTERNMHSFFAVTLEHHVGLCDSVGFRLKLLSKQMDGDFFTGLCRDLLKSVLCDS